MANEELTFHFSSSQGEQVMIRQFLFGTSAGVVIEFSPGEGDDDVLIEVSSCDIGVDDLARLFEVLASSLRSISNEDIEQAARDYAERALNALSNEEDGENENA